MTGKRKASPGQSPTDGDPGATRPPEMPEAMRPKDPEPVEEAHAHQSAIDAGRSASEEEAEERQKKLREDAEKAMAEADKAAEQERAEAERRRDAAAKVTAKLLARSADRAQQQQDILAEQENRELEGRVRADAARAEEIKRALEGDKPHPGQQAREEKADEERAAWQEQLAEHYRIADQARAEQERRYVETHQAAKAERERDPEQNPEGDEAEGQLGVATEGDEPAAKRKGPGPDPGPPEGREDEPTVWDLRPGSEPGREVPVGGAAPGVPSGHARPWQDRRDAPGHFKAADLGAAKGGPSPIDKFAKRKPKAHEIAETMIHAGIEHCRKGGTGDDHTLIRSSLTLAQRMLGRQWYRLTGRHAVKAKREEAAAKADQG
jgi:chemotaxis protein histidine kinase CheA